MPEMSGPTAPDDASFTLPARPGVLLLEHPRVDLLARETPRRRMPEGTASGFGVLGALVLFSLLVGGPTAGFVVVGVSALLCVSAALVTGHLSVSATGAQRGANLLLGVGAAALILGSVVSQQTRPAPELAGTPVPVSSGGAVEAASTPAPVPTPASRSTPGAAAQAAPTEPVQATEAARTGGPTLSLDALAPRPAQEEVVPARVADLPTDTGKGIGHGAAQAGPATQQAQAASTAPGQAKRAGNSAGGAARASKGATAATSGSAADKAAPSTVGKTKAAKATAAKAKAAKAKAAKTNAAKAKAAKTKAKPAAPLRRGFASVRSAVHDLF